jgi:polyhydroxyalkanoate synthesis regulator phasin
MTQNDIFRRSIEAGIAFTEMTRSRAEEIVRDVARSGELQWDQVQEQVEDLIEWSRRNTEQLIGLIRKEVATELSQLGIVTREHLEAVEQRLDERLDDVARVRAGRETAKRAPAKKAPAKKASTAKAATGKATAGKATATKAPAKKATAAKKGTVTKAPAKKATAAKKATGTRAAAKKAAPAGKATPARGAGGTGTASARKV